MCWQSFLMVERTATQTQRKIIIEYPKTWFPFFLRDTLYINANVPLIQFDGPSHAVLKNIPSFTKNTNEKKLTIIYTYNNDNNENKLNQTGILNMARQTNRSTNWRKKIHTHTHVWPLFFRHAPFDLFILGFLGNLFVWPTWYIHTRLLEDQYVPYTMPC